MAIDRKVYRPQKGPQMELLKTNASIAIFGGAAGSGKTYGILLEALWHYDKKGYTCAIFRKNSVQLKSPGGLWSSSQEMFREFGGVPKETTLEWNFPSGAHYKMSHLDHASDIYSWQGSQIALCVAKGTPILMGDNSYKNIEDVKEGDLVKTLKGQKKVFKTFPSKSKKCVSAKTYDLKGEFICEQIHPLDHKILTAFGWTSWDDLTRLYDNDLQPILHVDQNKSSLLTAQKFETLPPCEQPNIQKQEQILKQDRLFSDNPFYEEKDASLKDDQNYFSKSYDELLKNPLPLKLCVPVMLHQPFFQSIHPEFSLLNENIFYPVNSHELHPKKRQLWLYCNNIFQELQQFLLLLKPFVSCNNRYNSFEEVQGKLSKSLKFLLSHIFLSDQLLFHDEFYNNSCLLLRAIYDVQDWLKQEDFQASYSTCSGQYDEQFHLLLDNVQSYLQQQVDVVERFFPSLSNSDAKDKSQEYNRSYHIEYAHPYTAEVDRTYYPVEFGTCVITPCVECDVYDLSVEEDNHYITINGLINQNCIFDELTHFSKEQFFYMLSRNRSLCGVKPKMRGTTNPDANSWVRDLVDWYIDPETGYAIPERSGVIRWFVMLDDKMHWADSEQELKDKFYECLPKSFTFISASIYDNQKLLEIDTGYLANLHALPKVERERLLNGNWNIKPSAGLYFQKSYFEIVDAIPAQGKFVRYWDRASTKKTDNNNPDFTVGIKLFKDLNNFIYVVDMIRFQESPHNVQSMIKNTAIADGKNVQIGIEQDPAQAGVFEADYLSRLLQGFNVKKNRVMKDKITRATPVSAQSECGNIKVLRGKWNDDFFRELENFPDGDHDDIVDAFSGAFFMLNESSYSLKSMSK